MENKVQLSVWGKWWMPFRKWFYTAWLAYELTIQTYNYGIGMYDYFDGDQSSFTEIIACSTGVFMFLICSFFLTVPACFSLFHFFKFPSNTTFELRLKRFL